MLIKTMRTMRKHWKKKLLNLRIFQIPPWQLKLPEEDDVVYLKIDKALLSRPDIAKLLLESENQAEQANNLVNSVNVGQQNTSTSSVVPLNSPLD